MTDRVLEAAYHLSPMQQGMLFHHVAGAAPGVDIEQIVSVLRESLDHTAFVRAWEQVVARHPVCRTTFRWRDVETPLQEVHPHVPLAMTVHDWRTTPAPAQRQQLEDYLAEDRASPFDLTAPPLMRLALFQVADAEYWCIWTFPHLLLDGWSFPIILRELFGGYDALRERRTVELAPTRPYQDYVEWLEQRDTSGDEAFWRGALHGLAARTSLDGLERGSGPPSRGEQELRLAASVTATLVDVARASRVTMNTVVQGAWAVLLSRYGGVDDVLFGATRAGRRATFANVEEMVGVFINTLPVRVRVEDDVPVTDWLQRIRAEQRAVRDHEHASLADVQRWSGVSPGTPLFESLLVFDRQQLNSALRAAGGSWDRREFRLLERTSYPLTLYAYAEPELLLKIAYDRPRFADGAITRLLRELATVLEAIAADPQRTVASLPSMTPEERHALIVARNDTSRAYPRDSSVHDEIEKQVERTPDRIAVVADGVELTYRELDARANQLAHRLRTLGVTRGVLVGLCTGRSLEMVVAVLAVLKAGGAYVPLDPAYPAERLAFMLDDAGMTVLLTEERHLNALPEHRGITVCVDAWWAARPAEPADRLGPNVRPDDLAYVIYTSGSTGTPKGVMVEHRNVVNFFAGMDDRLGPSGGVWLAVTSLSFDISVLELCWTLARGFTVVLHDGAGQALRPATSAYRGARKRTIDFSLFYFASDDGSGDHEKYRLLLDGARFADQRGFAAVWTPERHFHAFGGLYPNPSVTGAAIAAVTSRIHIRAGSVVLPLHSPVRVAEEWAVVDNISNGRVGISFASGWQPEDFVLAPANFADRKDVMLQGVELVRKLWRGDSVTMPGVAGAPVMVRTLPRPVQAELPVWITTAGNADSYRAAGEAGARVLTHLLGQSVDEVAEKIATYRRAWEEHGHPAGGARVTLMLHTLVGDDDDSVRELVRGPMTDYLRSSVSLIKNFAASFPAFRGHTNGRDAEAAFAQLSPQDMEALLEHAFARYFETSGLFGTPARCLAMIERLRAIGVDEVACLIDFGVDAATVLHHLHHLDALRELANTPAVERDSSSIAAQIARYGVTHLQCTPSMARMLVAQEESRTALASLRTMLVGGEALPVPLARELRSLLTGDLLNMYGPTETTIWSATHEVREVGDTVPIGRPIANTRLYILDRHRRPTPPGVAGELYIGGAGVARGYLHRPELTAERFVPDPFGGVSDDRLYRTGDLARYRADGSVEFLGRVDQQVKIRGHRIELGEIESVLVRHTSVQVAAVLARDELPEDTRLVAYVVPRGGAAPTAADLRAHLRRTLPEPMIPSAFVILDTLPLTPNGKLDRKALPAPAAVPQAPDAAYTPPAGEMEEIIAEVWRDVLGTPQVGTRDNFFDLGGHSLLAVQVHTRLRLRLARDVAITDLFRFPTINALAAHLGGGVQASHEALVQNHDRGEARRALLLRQRERRQKQ